MPFHRYTLFGLHLLSEIELPELRRAEGAGHDDVSIRVRPALSGDGTRLSIEGVADFAVVEGRLIYVVPHANSTSAGVRLFLLGSVMGLLLHQRKELPLHANCVVKDGRAAAFVGASGAGKSTLAAWMGANGCLILSDDVCAIEFGPGQNLFALPGIPRLRLWEDSLAQFGWNCRGLQPSYPDDPNYRKFDLPLNANVLADTKAPMSAIYLLGKGPEFAVEPVLGADAVETLFAHTYRGEYVIEDGDPSVHWQKCVALASAVPMFKARRTMQPASMDDENSALLEHFSQLALDSPPLQSDR